MEATEGGKETKSNGEGTVARDKSGLYAGWRKALEEYRWQGRHKRLVGCLGKRKDQEGQTKEESREGGRIR